MLNWHENLLSFLRVSCQFGRSKGQRRLGLCPHLALTGSMILGFEVIRKTQEFRATHVPKCLVEARHNCLPKGTSIIWLFVYLCLICKWFPYYFPSHLLSDLNMFINPNPSKTLSTAPQKRKETAITTTKTTLTIYWCRSSSSSALAWLCLYYKHDSLRDSWNNPNTCFVSIKCLNDAIHVGTSSLTFLKGFSDACTSRFWVGFLLGKDHCGCRQGGVSVAVTSKLTESLSVLKTVRCAHAGQWMARQKHLGY